MGKLVMLALLAGGGYFVYEKYLHKSEALLAYIQYSEAYRFGKCDILRAAAEEKALADVEQYCASATFMGRQMPSAASMANDMANTPSGVMLKLIRTVESESKDSGGEVTLKLVEKVGGMSRNSGMNTSPRRITARLRQTGGSWKVLEVVDLDAAPL